MKFLCRLRALGSDGDYRCMHAGKTADDISMTYTLRNTLEKTGKKIHQNSEAVCQVQWHKLVIRNSISSTVQNEEEGSLKLLTLLSARLT